MIELNTFNIFLTLIVVTILIGSYFIKIRKMKIEHLEKAKSIAQQIERTKHQLSEVEAFPYDNEKAKLVVISGGKDLVLSAGITPITAREFVELYISRLKSKIQILNFEFESL